MPDLQADQFGHSQPWVNTGPAHAKLARLEAQEHVESPPGEDPRRAVARRARNEMGGTEVQKLRSEVGHTPGPKEMAGQQQLFPRSSVAQPEAHQQTPEQFANDDRSWWHGRYAKSARLTKGGTDEGFHAGSSVAARQRLRTNFGRRSGDAPARMFPLRLTGETGSRATGTGSTPENPSYDQNKHSRLSDSAKGYFYKNDVEDRGHISVGVPKREGHLSTHRDMVKAAQDSGKYVHPNIAWAAKKFPDHTGEDTMASFRSRYDTPKGPEQPQLHPEQFRNLPRSNPYDRRVVDTEGGKRLSVWRSTGIGNKTNEPNVWVKGG